VRCGASGGEEASELVEESGCTFSLGHIDVDEPGNLARQAQIGGEQNDGDFGFAFAHEGGDLAAVHAGHGVVEDDGLDGVIFEDLETGGAILRGKNGVPGTLEEHFSDVESDFLVIYAKYEVAHRHRVIPILLRDRTNLGEDNILRRFRVLDREVTHGTFGG